MGRLKQLLPYRGKTLVEHAVEQALEAGFNPVVVVLGAGSGQVRALLAADDRITLLDNPAWQSGMGTSLAAGARYLREQSGQPPSAVAVLLADQPLVTAGHLRRMQEHFECSGETRIVAAEYNGTLGVPAFFPASMLNTLEALKPEEGARSLLRDPNQIVDPFDLPEAAMDVDTPDDFARLTEREH